MAYSSTNPATMLMDGFSSEMPRLFIYRSSHSSSDIAAIGSTAGTSAMDNLGFFAGAGDLSRGLNGIGMRTGDIVINVCTATRVTTDMPQGMPGITTIHSVIACTANGSTLSSSVAYDASVGQASL